MRPVRVVKMQAKYLSRSLRKILTIAKNNNPSNFSESINFPITNHSLYIFDWDLIVAFAHFLFGFHGSE